MKAQLERFRSWMTARGYAKLTVDRYVPAMGKLLGDPAGVQRNERTYFQWRQNRAAAVQWETFAGDSGPWEAIRRIQGPRKPPPRPIHVPELEEWFRIGRDAWRRPGPLGAVLWIVVYSGLRISDVLLLTREQVAEGASTSRVSDLRHKSSGGRGAREWLVSALVRPGVVRLLGSGRYRWIWQLLSTSKDGAEDAIRAKIPHPYTPHSFRHATCSYLISLGVPPAVAMRLTGHTSLSAFERYVHESIAVPPDRVREAQTLLSRALVSAGMRAEVQDRLAGEKERR